MKGVSFIWYPFLLYQYGFDNILFDGEKGSGKGHLVGGHIVEKDDVSFCFVIRHENQHFSISVIRNLEMLGVMKNMIETFEKVRT